MPTGSTGNVLKAKNSKYQNYGYKTPPPPPVLQHEILLYWASAIKTAVNMELTFKRKKSVSMITAVGLLNGQALTPALILTASADTSYLSFICLQFLHL